MSLVALTVAAALSGQAAPANVLPIVPGSTPAPDCGGMRDIVSPGNSSMQCVTSSMEQASNLFISHLAQARAAGWGSEDGASNVIWFWKPSTGGKCDRLTVVGFWDFQRHPEPVPGIPAYVGLAIAPGQDCPAAR
jgi:hypothetical protein